MVIPSQVGLDKSATLFFWVLVEQNSCRTSAQNNCVVGNYLMWSLFMYILQSHNYFALSLIPTLCYLVLLLIILAFTLPCLTSHFLVCCPYTWCPTPLYSTTFCNNHTTGRSIPISKFTGPSGSPTTQ